MRVVVPFDATTPKSRLGGALDAEERTAFARAMLRDVCSAVVAAGGDPVVLATAPLDVTVAATDDVVAPPPEETPIPVVVDEQPLTDAVNDGITRAFAADQSLGDRDDPAPVDALAVVMADLALATPAALGRLFEADGEVVLVPGRGGGTNALVTRTPGFRVDYHDASIRDHRERAASCADSVTELDSYRLSTDVDDPADLVEVLLHGEGGAASWLREAGFSVTATGGRVDVERS